MKKSRILQAFLALVLVFDVPFLDINLNKAEAGSHSKKAIQSITHAGFGGGTDVTTSMMLFSRGHIMASCYLVLCY